MGLVGLPSKYAAFRRPGPVPVRFNDGTVFVNSIIHIGVLGRSYFLFFMFAEK